MGMFFVMDVNTVAKLDCMLKHFLMETLLSVHKTCFDVCLIAKTISACLIFVNIIILL